MSGFFKRWGGKGDGAEAAAAKARIAAADTRSAMWAAALAANDLPAFVKQRLQDAGAGRSPWLSTMTPAELLLARSHGVRPIATVSGTCWFQFGYSWTEGHAQGWRTALDRLRAEAVACGANAVVDVKMRTSPGGDGSSMDYTLVGTAVRFDRLTPSVEPVIATTPALEFVRLLEAGIVPTGIAVGAHYEWLTDYNGSFGGTIFSGNQPLNTLGQFWERVRRQAHQELRRDAASQGAGVLAHTQFGQIIKRETEKQPDRYLGRHIVIGTVVHTRPGQGVPHDIKSVVDMRDELSPLIGAGLRGGGNNQFNEEESPI